MSNYLDGIIERVRERTKVHKIQVPLSQLHEMLKSQRLPYGFAKFLRREPDITIIAEFKQASPSVGLIRQEKDPAGRLREYERGGSAALSILTEEDYFKGSLDNLDLARRTTSLPLLRKDFIIDPYQIVESRAMGADAILLIAALLPLLQLKEFMCQALELGLEALIEIHNENDLDKALTAEALLIGINHRDLRSMAVDMDTSRRLLPLIAKTGKTIVIESGIKGPDDLSRFHQCGVHAALIGEALMRDSNPEKLLTSFVRAGRAAG